MSEAGADAAGLSLQLTGTGTTYGDFTWQAPADDSPGAVNTGQTFGEGPGDVAPVIDAATPADQSVASGETATLTVTTTAGTEPLAYQWYEGDSGDETSPIADADEATFTTPALTEDATYWVQVSNAFGSADSRTVTVTVLDAVSIHDIQGAAHISPMNGQAVAGVPGIVTATRSNGFYIQETVPDADDHTSEGIFVFTSSRRPLRPPSATPSP